MIRIRELRADRIRQVTALVGIGASLTLAGVGVSTAWGGTKRPRAGAEQSVRASAHAAAGLQAAQANVKKYSNVHQTFTVPRLTKKPARGKIVLGLWCTLPGCEPQAQAAPAEALGWKYKTVAWDITKGPTALQAAFTNATNAKPTPNYIGYVNPYSAGVLSGLIPKAVAKGIHTYSVSAESIPSQVVCTACKAEFVLGGSLAADVALTNAGKKTRIATVVDPNNLSMKWTQAGVQSEVAKNGSGSTVSNIQVQLGGAPATNTAAIVNALQRDPSIHYLVIFGETTIAPNLASTLASDKLASSVKIITVLPQTQELAQVKKGSILASIVVEDEASYWRATDALARQSVGDPVQRDPAGWALIATKANTTTSAVPQPPNYQQKYLAAWGVSTQKTR